MRFTWFGSYQNMPSFLLIWSSLPPSTSLSHSRLGEPILVTDQAQIFQKGNNVIHWINNYSLDDANGFPNTYLHGSVIKRLNNRGQV